jgi:AcrR family transcriptional regulator
LAVSAVRMCFGQATMAAKTPAGNDRGIRRRPRQARSQNTVNAILTAAEELFSSKGFHNTTTEEIVCRAGTGIGSLYDYFPNKVALALALLESRSGVIADAARRVFISHGSEPLEQSLPMVIRALFESYRENSDIFITLVNDVPEVRAVADIYSVERLIHRTSLIFLRNYEDEIPRTDLASAHEFLNMMFVGGIRQYFAVSGHEIGEDEFIHRMARAIYCYLKDDVEPCV